MQTNRGSKYVRLFLVVTGLAIGLTRANAVDAKTAARNIGKIKLKTLREISGVAASRQNPDVLWVHNDGSSRFIFAVNTSGKLVALASWSIEIEDFEDIAIGPGPKSGVDYIYVGDIGDNNAQRSEIRVVRFAEPDVSQAHAGQIEVQAAEEFRLSYPDGPHNAEALIVDPLSRD